MLNINVAEWKYTTSEPNVLPVLSDTEIQLWFVNLDDGTFDPHLAAYQSTLSTEEIARWNRLRFARLKRRFIVRHGLLREVLSRHIGIAPKAIIYEYGVHGKPALKNASSSGQCRLFFNIADCEAIAVFAVSLAGEIGVDIERISRIPDMELVAQNWFSMDEQRLLASLAEAAKPRGFYTIWTRKEAIVKAVGEGITFPLKSFSVSADVHVPAQVIDSHSARLSRIALFHVPLPDNYANNYVAACAVRPKITD